MQFVVFYFLGEENENMPSIILGGGEKMVAKATVKCKTFHTARAIDASL